MKTDEMNVHMEILPSFIFSPSSSKTQNLCLHRALELAHSVLYVPVWPGDNELSPERDRTVKKISFFITVSNLSDVLNK